MKSSGFWIRAFIKPTHRVVAIPRNILTATSVREEEIISVLGEKLHAEVLYANETLADHQIDSLGLVELIVYLEEGLNISVDMDQVNPLQTLEEFVRYLAGCDERSGANLDELILHGPLSTKTNTFFNPFNELFLLLVRACIFTLLASPDYP